LLATLVDVGELEPGTRLLVQRLLRHGESFVDVGANVGMISLAAGSAVGKEGRIIAFEPHPITHDLLRKSLLLNGFAEMARTYQAAVSNRSGRQPLFLGVTSGHHSLYPLDTTPITGAGTVEVPLVRIDDVIGTEFPVDLMKIDVEGAELEVLEGAAATIANNSDIALLVEFGYSHLHRTGQTTTHWLDAFERLGMQYRAIDPASGALLDWSPRELEAAGSINLLFARPSSKAWERARGTT
jgi:FkbM family methyltransferase